jgi:hypothetical protein
MLVANALCWFCHGAAQFCSFNSISVYYSTGFLNGHNDYFTYTTRYKTFHGYDLRENEAPANIRKYRGKYSTHIFTEKTIDIFKNDQTGKV